MPVNINNITTNLGDIGSLLSVVAIIASWTATWQPRLTRGFKSEKIAYLVSGVSLGLAWFSLFSLLVYGLAKIPILFYVSYLMIIFSSIGQLYTFLYFQVYPLIISAKQREENIDKFFFRYLKST